MFNLNHEVWVKLTEAGLHQWKAHYDPYTPKADLEYYRAKANNEGYTSFQMHVLMSIFGENIGLTQDLPFSTNILIHEKHLV